MLYMDVNCPLVCVAVCVALCVAVLTWSVYCLAVDSEVQLAARQEVQQICAETGDVTSAAVEQMT